MLGGQRAPISEAKEIVAYELVHFFKRLAASKVPYHVFVHFVRFQRIISLDIYSPNIIRQFCSTTNRSRALEHVADIFIDALFLTYTVFLIDCNVIRLKVVFGNQSAFGITFDIYR